MQKIKLNPIRQWRRQDLQFGRAKPDRRRREQRGAEGAETETPKALRGREMGRGFPPPQQTRGSGHAEERRKLPQRGPGGAPAKNDSSVAF